MFSYALYEKLTGRKMPVHVSENEVPAPSQEHMDRYVAFNRLATNDDFSLFLAFVRETANGVLDGKKAAVATELELRAAKVQHEVAVELGPMVLRFLGQTDELLDKRDKWLEKQQKGDQTPTAATSI